MALSLESIVHNSPEKGLAIVRSKGGAKYRFTDTLSTSGLIHAGACAVHWIDVSDTAALAMELNDSLDDSGVDSWSKNFPAGAYAHFNLDPPKPFANGLYLDVSTATCKIEICYEVD